jgi:hypothetical protein
VPLPWPSAGNDSASDIIAVLAAEQDLG